MSQGFDSRREIWCNQQKWGKPSGIYRVIDGERLKITIPNSQNSNDFLLQFPIILFPRISAPLIRKGHKPAVQFSENDHDAKSN